MTRRTVFRIMSAVVIGIAVLSIGSFRLSAQPRAVRAPKPAYGQETLASSSAVLKIPPPTADGLLTG
jgi:hypothetical protein